MKKYIFLILLILIICISINASTLLSFVGKYKDKNLTLNIEIRKASYLTTDENGKKKGGSSQNMIFRLVPENGRIINNPQVIYKKTEYDLKILKDQYDSDESASINIKNEKEPYIIEFIYETDDVKTKDVIVIAKKLSLKSGKPNPGNISDLYIKITDISDKYKKTNKIDKDIDRLEQSKKNWEELNKKNNGNYSYKTGFASWAGFGNETTIIVKNNKVVGRKYREYQYEKDNIVEKKSWEENESNLGSHNEGDSLKTIDDLYMEAKKILKHKFEKYEKLYISFDDNGILNSCFYVDTRIMDDAPQYGVDIFDVILGE